MVGDQQAVAATDPFIRGLIDQIDAVLLDFHSLCDPLTHEQLSWQPERGRWSIAQCLRHTTLTLQLYPAQIERMIAEARARHAAGQRPFREGFLARKVVSGQEPPPRMRIRTMRSVDPAPDIDRDTVLREFESAHLRLRELILAADGVPLDHARMRSPFVSLIRMTLRQVFQVNLAHARRHLWQARQVRQTPGFPA